MRPIVKSALLSIAIAAFPAATAGVIDVTVPSPIIPGPTVSPGELHIQRSIQSRQNFQLEQRINREIDRLTVQQPLPQPKVERSKPSCVQDTNGRRDLRDCR